MAPLIEIERIESLIRNYGSMMRVQVLDQVSALHHKFPLYSLEIGSENPEAPTVGIFGGVHGLERVGTHVAVAFLEHLLELLKWDKHTQQRMAQCRIVSIPLINPAGMYLGKRSNPNNIDLMRDSPVRADDPAFLLGGHRLASWLPWYMGPENKGWEKESKAMVDFVKKTCFASKSLLTLDLHSGFGAQDRLWFPYAKTKTPFPDFDRAVRLNQLLNQTHPHHVYLVESQSVSYTTHGDLWDYLYDQFQEQKSPDQVYIPWTLEMGSWIWIRKNPPQIFSSLGPFNPVKPHRHRRTMRRHVALLDFFLRAVCNKEVWN